MSTLCRLCDVFLTPWGVIDETCDDPKWNLTIMQPILLEAGGLNWRIGNIDFRSSPFQFTSCFPTFMLYHVWSWAINGLEWKCNRTRLKHQVLSLCCCDYIDSYSGSRPHHWYDKTCRLWDMGDKVDFVHGGCDVDLSYELSVRHFVNMISWQPDKMSTRWIVNMNWICWHHYVIPYSIAYVPTRLNKQSRVGLPA